MCACLAKAGLFPDWQTAFAACQLKRPCVRLNAKMRRVLEAWEREYPTRVSGTAIVNPDYMAIAAAYGFHGERVTETAQFADAYQRACDSPTGAIVEIVTSTEAISPRTTITALRAAAGK